MTTILRHEIDGTDGDAGGSDWRDNQATRHCHAIGHVALLAHLGQIQAADLVLGTAAQQASAPLLRRLPIRCAGGF
jgi:hypothetical protein